LLGEPRVAVWPVSDQTDSNHQTATDRAVAYDATLGTVGATGSAPYYFARHDATTATDDLNASIVPGNAALFSNLVAAGKEQPPGQSATFLQKYPGAEWPQLVVEILDAIRGFNAIDPAAGSLAAPTSFVPFAAGNSAGLGRGLIVPLTASSSSAPVRGLGRYPTLSGLTLVLYVSGYGFTDGTTIDYETTPDDLAGTSWTANFLPKKAPDSRWSQVNKALVRAFIVPTTFQPNCGFPEVSEACSIQISGLDQLGIQGATTNFGFPKTCISRLLSDALTVPNADRSWGGFEGPLAWRAAALDAMNNGPAYAFAGTQAVPITLASGAAVDSRTGGPSLSTSWAKNLSTSALSGLTVQILDASGNVVQTCNVNLPALNASVPVVNGEADHYDGSTPGTSHTDWATNAAYAVAPSYYMTLRNRLLATQRSRPLMIQAGDASLSVEANTDLRLVAALATVPASFFHQATTIKAQASQTSPSASLGSHYHNLRFADGTSACFAATQNPTLVGDAYAATTASFSVTDWDTGGKVTYVYDTSPVASAPINLGGTMAMAAPGAANAGTVGDWDTGLGAEPDGALANLPDAGTTLDPATAYESLSGGQVGAATRYSPNALIPSPVVFGSLPAGINPATPASSVGWRTLLFCPYPASDQAHPGLASPPDYLMLDRFWMPVVEPYGISTRFATSGKINLNDQIAPFTYLHRNTALHALLHNLRIPAISPIYASSYKSMPPPGGLATPGAVWRTLDENATIAQIESRFASGDAYLTEGEICSVPLVPQNLNGVTPELFWTSRSGAGYLTGDNLRELPYAQIYSRLTTRSNSYTVHILAQVLQKLNDRTSPAVWREGIDHVVGDWRGSYEIERYLDPNATAPAAGQPLGPYKFRIVSERRFSP
jgi:uncharacterized protein (TIGR02600 family)